VNNEVRHTVYFRQRGLRVQITKVGAEELLTDISVDRLRQRQPKPRSFGSAPGICPGRSEQVFESTTGRPVQRVAFLGSYLPFPKTAAEREKTGDPRKSIAERYASAEGCSARYKIAVDDLVKQRWILPEDRAALLLRGEQEWAEATK
jgi:Alpha/beta hydrolase domain